MQNGNQDETGLQRRAGRRSALALVAIVVVAGTAGIVISLGQHPAPVPPAPTALIPLRTTPSPIPAEPEVGTSFAVADDLATHDVVLFGGEDNGDNTWLWNGTSWTLARPQVSPTGRFGASAAYDPATRTVLLFGGRTEDGVAVNDTWAWNGVTWNEIDFGTDGPEAGEGSDMAWDAAQRQMVLVIGLGGTGSGATWVWTGSHWLRPPAGTLPGSWFYSPMWPDPASGVLTAVGCCSGPPTPAGAVELHLAMGWQRMAAGEHKNVGPARWIDDGARPAAREARALHLRVLELIGARTRRVDRLQLAGAAGRCVAGAGRYRGHRCRSRAVAPARLTAVEHGIERRPCRGLEAQRVELGSARLAGSPSRIAYNKIKRAKHIKLCQDERGADGTIGGGVRHKPLGNGLRHDVRGIY